MQLIPLIGSEDSKIEWSLNDAQQLGCWVYLGIMFKCVMAFSDFANGII